ncbi:MAG: DUF393 domain-containing protein [Dehalococcoidia bacterium]
MSEVAPVLLYDDDCRFCRACADLVQRWDRRGRLAILPFSDPFATERMASLDPDLRERSMHVAYPDGSLASGGQAMIALLKHLPGAGWLGRLAERFPPLGWLVGRSYFLVANRRGFFSRLVTDRPAPIRRPQSIRPSTAAKL